MKVVKLCFGIALLIVAFFQLYTDEDFTVFQRVVVISLGIIAFMLTPEKLN